MININLIFIIKMLIYVDKLKLNQNVKVCLLINNVKNVLLDNIGMKIDVKIIQFNYHKI